MHTLYEMEQNSDGEKAGSYTTPRSSNEIVHRVMKMKMLHCFQATELRANRAINRILLQLCLLVRTVRHLLKRKSIKIPLQTPFDLIPDPEAKEMKMDT